MKKLLYLSLFSLSVLLFNSCGLVQGIFKAGMWTGFLIVGLVIAFVVWLLFKVMGGRKD